jgi:hypothetical protein
MTKKKAIEAAITRALQAAGDVPMRFAGSVDAVADRAYEAGRIAGLREAVRMDSSGKAIWDILDRANALAKKARAK